MAHVCFPAPLIKKTNVAACNVDGKSVQECLSQIIRDFPDIRSCMFTNEKLSPFIKIFINQIETSSLNGLETAVKSTDEIQIVVATSGG